MNECKPQATGTTNSSLDDQEGGGYSSDGQGGGWGWGMDGGGAGGGKMEVDPEADNSALVDDLAWARETILHPGP